MAKQVSIGVLISGSGTNLQAIIDAIEGGKLDARIEVVISNKADAYGLVRARNHRIPTEVLNHKNFSSREAYDEALVALLGGRGVELVVLAGFMRLLSPMRNDFSPIFLSTCCTPGASLRSTTNIRPNPLLKMRSISSR